MLVQNEKLGAKLLSTDHNDSNEEGAGSPKLNGVNWTAWHGVSLAKNRPLLWHHVGLPP